MEPRLSTSRKWNPLPKELLQQIQTVFKQTFTSYLNDTTVEASGKIFPEEILVQVSLKQKGTLKQAGWSVSISYKTKKDNVMQLLHLSVDALASLFEQYFESENDHDFPRTWEEVDFEKRKIYVAYTTVNSELEAEADRWLGNVNKGEEDVAQGDWDEDVDPAIIKAQLGLTEDEDEDKETETTSKPSSPSGKGRSRGH
jgi:hypothetical protein